MKKLEIGCAGCRKTGKAFLHLKELGESKGKTFAFNLPRGWGVSFEADKPEEVVFRCGDCRKRIGS